MSKALVGSGEHGAEAKACVEGVRGLEVGIAQRDVERVGVESLLAVSRNLTIALIGNVGV